MTSSHNKAAVQRQPQVRTMLDRRRLAANRKVRRMAATIPNTAPVVHFTPSRSRYQFILLGEQRHMCVNNLPNLPLHIQCLYTVWLSQLVLCKWIIISFLTFFTHYILRCPCVRWYWAFVVTSCTCSAGFIFIYGKSFNCTGSDNEMYIVVSGWWRIGGYFRFSS